MNGALADSTKYDGRFKIMKYIAKSSKKGMDGLALWCEVKKFANRFTPSDIKFSPPNFSKIFSYNPPEMSEDEYEQAIIKQAYEDSANGIWYNSKANKALHKSYVQCVSPDRVSIYKHSMKMTGGKMNLGRSFYDSLGNKVMDFINNWWVSNTDSELQRMADYNNLYQKAWKEAEAKKTLKINTPPSNLMLDVKG